MFFLKNPHNSFTLFSDQTVAFFYDLILPREARQGGEAAGKAVQYGFLSKSLILTSAFQAEWYDRLCLSYH